MRAFLLCLTGVLALSACRSVWDPTFQPAGYSYHRNEFKSPPGPPASDIGYAYTESKNEQVLNEWRFAIGDMLQKAQNWPIPGELALTSDLEDGAFKGTYDSLMREQLRASGHTVLQAFPGLRASPATKAPQLFFSAYGPKTKDQLKQGGLKEYNDDPQHPEDPKFMPDTQKMELVLALVKDGKVLQRISGLYDLQVYGYPEGVAAYVPGFERPVHGVSVKTQPPARSFNR